MLETHLSSPSCSFYSRVLSERVNDSVQIVKYVDFNTFFASSLTTYMDARDLVQEVY